MRQGILEAEARAAVAQGRAKAHALMAIITDEHQRDGYMLKPLTWEGPGEYQWVTFADGRDGFVRLLDHLSIYNPSPQAKHNG
jgi:hypothetical protein